MNNEHLPISRRRLLAGTSAVAAAGLLEAFPSQTAFARAPMLNTQAPHFYRFKLGNFEGTIVSDGTLPLGKPEDNFVGLTKPEMGKQLTDNFLPLENVVLEQNALVINTGDKLVLFDTGMGGLKLFGPTTGKLLNVTDAPNLSGDDRSVLPFLDLDPVQFRVLDHEVVAFAIS